MELTARRSYKVILPDDKDYTLVLNGEAFPWTELIEAITYEADIGNLSGTMLYVVELVEENGREYKAWINAKERYAEFVLRTCPFEVEDLGMVID